MSIHKHIPKILSAYRQGQEDARTKKPSQAGHYKGDLKKAYKNGYNSLPR